MRFSRMVRTIDTHTGGEPTRTIIGGLPKIPGASMGEKMLYLRDNLDDFRTFLMLEPRGHEVMSGAIVTEPTHPQAHVGVVYIEVGGYLPMCGHDTIGLATALVETGFVEVQEPETTIILDTPAGLVEAFVEVEDHVAKSVTFKNIPSFVMARDVTIQVPKLGEITIDVSYGGNVYAIVNAKDVGLKVETREAPDIIAIGNRIKEAVNEQVPIQHPEKDFINKCTHVEFSTQPTSPKAHRKNAVVFPPGAIDRSPCGTGTSAKLASLYARGQWNIGEEFVHESIIGTLFRGKIREETTIGDYKAVVPEITGSAYIMGFNTLVLDPDDPLPKGFLLGK